MVYVYLLIREVLRQHFLQTVKPATGLKALMNLMMTTNPEISCHVTELQQHLNCKNNI